MRYLGTLARPGARRTLLVRLCLAITGSLVFLSLNLPNIARADDRDLHPGFGAGGKVVTDFFGGDDGALAIVMQPDGKIVATGFASHKVRKEGTSDFALSRYNVDGSLDSTFGKGGKVTTDFLSGFDGASAVALQPDGKIVAAGGALDENDWERFT